MNSITVFAKCHHSWIYYPTKVGSQHPTLRGDLMGRQIKAAHAIGVRAPIYITVGWSETEALKNPGWVSRNRDGTMSVHAVQPGSRPTDKRPVAAWHNMCPSGAYRDLILRQTEEVCVTYPTDGIFYDICNMLPCWCANCTAAMKTRNIHPDDLPAVRAYAQANWIEFMHACRSTIFKHHPNATVFFNGLAQMSAPREVLDCQTHFELEDLPTTWGGYDKFPPRAHFFSKLDRPMLAMSGKFHTMWGEFGGFKHPDAIRFEAAGMIASGAACSIGDQLHPSGEMDMGTYANIGAAYEYVEKIEQFGLGGKPFSKLGVLLSKGRTTHAEHGVQPDGHDQGTFNMLMEAQLEFEIADLNDLHRFDTIILTGGAWLDADSAAAINQFVKLGGKLLVCYESGLSADRKKMLLDIGGTYLGPARFELDYTAVGKSIATDLVASPFLNYTPAVRVKPTTGKPLAAIHEPYFDRTYARFCSHQNTANQPEPAEHAAAIQNGRIVFLAHPLGEMYYKHGARVHRQMFINAIRKLHSKPTVELSLPSAARVSLLHQPDHKRFALHLTYGPPLQRGRCLVIEDLPELRNTAVTLRVPGKIKRVVLPLTRKKLATRKLPGGISFTVPLVQCHEVVIIEY